MPTNPTNQSTSFVEHVNATVPDIDQALRFFTHAVPTWRRRGGGSMDWYGKTIPWLHVGDDQHYIALQGGGEGAGPDWQTHQAGIKHVGIVVPSVHEVVQRLQDAGFALDHWGGETAHRLSVYFLLDSAFQVEFVEYKTQDAALRNLYL
jgi:catechol 2,3-dioxygenase-like lactoylglutathione lyase family enzyme